jgi:hypothetical protein
MLVAKEEGSFLIPSSFKHKEDFMVDIVYFKNRGDVELNCILIENDLFGVVTEIQNNIDKGYFIVFNPNNQKFELHHIEQPDTTYCLTFPFDGLDGRAVEYTRKTSVTRAKTIKAEMKAHNERLEMARQKATENEVGWKSKEMYKYAIRHGADGYIPDDAYSSRWN